MSGHQRHAKVYASLDQLADDLLRDLSSAVAALQEQIDALAAEVVQLRQECQGGGS